MARKTNIYTQLHNANIGEYVTDSIDIFDSYSNQSQYDFNKSVRSMIANSAVIGGVSNLKLKITPSSFYVKSTEGCTLTCEVTFNGEDYTDVVIKWQIERISVNKQDDEEWFEKKNNGETPLTNVIEITTADLNGDAAMFIVTAIITTDMKCDNSVSLMGYSSQGLFTFDLNNQVDFVATDNMYEVQWNQFIETRATLTYGQTRITPDEISFEYNGLPQDCASYNNLEELDITVTLPKGVKVSYNNALIINVSGNYKGEKYNKQAIFSIKADTDGVIYNVAPSRDKIRLSSTGVYTPTSISCGVRKRTINGITYPKSLPSTLKLTMVIDDGVEQEITPQTNISLFGPDMTVVNNGIVFTLYEKDQFLDQEWVPVISDGVTGESTIKLDLDNEMDAIPVDINYIVLEDTKVTTNATMYYGYDEMTFVRNAATNIKITTTEKEEEQYISNIKTKLTYKKNNKLLTITLSCTKGVRIPKRITVTVSAMGAYKTPGEEGYRAKAQTAIFSVVPMVVSDETPLYYLIPSANSIKVDKTNARQPINIGVTCKKRTGQTGYITTDYGYVEYRIDDEKVQRYVKPLDTEDIGEQIVFEYYDDNGELLDRESIPVIFDGRDGISGRSIKDMHEYYLATATSEDIPGYDEEWILDEFPDESLFNEEFPYLWNYEETIYINYGDDPSVWRSTPSIITHYVKGIKSIDEYYLSVPENSGIDTSYIKEQDIFMTRNGLYEWQKTVIPEMSDVSAYLWNFERINYDNNTFTTTTPGIIGIHGESNFYVDIDNQNDFIAVDQWGYVIPSNVHYEDTIIVYAQTDKFGNIIEGCELKPRDIIFEDNPSNEGTVVIKSNFTVYYGNNKAEVKGIGFEYSDTDGNFKACAPNLPNTIYPIIITHDNSMNEESEPDLIGSYYNPYKIDDVVTYPGHQGIPNTAGKGSAKPEYVDRGDVYVSGYIVGYITISGDNGIIHTGAPGTGINADVLPTDIKGIVLYDKIWENGIDDARHALMVMFDETYTDVAIYNPEPDAADITASEEDAANPDLHPYGINIKNRVQYLDKVVNIMGIMKNGKLVATDYAEIVYGDDKIIRFSTVFGAYDLSSIDFYIFVKPNALIAKNNWVRIAVDVELYGKIHRLYAVLSLYAAAPGQDARFYQLQPSHKQIQRKKNGSYVPSIETNITCHIVKRIGNDFLYDVPFYDPEDENHDNDAYGDVSLFYAIDSGDYVYVPFTDPEYTEIMDAIKHPSDLTEDEEGNLITNLEKYAALRILPPLRADRYRERRNPTIISKTDEEYILHPEKYPENVQTYETIQTELDKNGNEVEYGNYYVAKNDNSRRSCHYGEFPMWKLRDIFNGYLNLDGTFKTDEFGNTIAAFSQISFLLTDAKTGEQVDLVQIPVIYDGEETIIADLTNEMDAVAMNELNYTIADSVLHTTFTIRVGKENKNIKELGKSTGHIGPDFPADLHLLVDETYELPLTNFKVKHKDNSITENITGTVNNNANPTNGIYWEYTYIVETNEYEIDIHVPGGIGDEKIDGEDIWKHNRLILEVRATIEHVSGTPNEPEQLIEITRSCLFTIHGIACGEDSVIYQIHPTYNNIKINDIGEYQPDTIDCFITRRYGTADPSIYKGEDTVHFRDIYKNFLLGPTERTEHEFGRDSLVIGYTIDGENNLNNNAFQAAHWWVHKDYADAYIQSDDDNDTGSYFPFPADIETAAPDAYSHTYEGGINGAIERSDAAIAEVLADTDTTFFDYIDYPSIPSYWIGESITFYLYQKTLQGDYRLLDLETVPVVPGAHDVNPNLVNGTEDGGISKKEKWITGGSSTTGLHNFRMYDPRDTLTSPYIFMQPGKEFIVSLEYRLLKIENGNDIAIDEDIDMVPPEYADISFTPPVYTIEKDNISKRLDRNNEIFTDTKFATLGYHTLTLEFFDKSQITPEIKYTEDDEEVINGEKTVDDIKVPANSNGILFFKGYNTINNSGYSRNINIITNWGNSDKSRLKEWTRVKFAPYQADDIIADTEEAYFKLTYNKPAKSPYVLQIRHIKLEYGDVATMWLPSVWDNKGETTERVYEFYWATEDVNASPEFWKTVPLLEQYLEAVPDATGQNTKNLYPLAWETQLHELIYHVRRQDYIWYDTTAAAGHGLDKPYLWNVEVIVNQHDTIASISEPALITVSGQKIVEMHEYYLATNMGTGVTYSTPGWLEYNQDAPESVGKYTFGLNDHRNYLWNYEYIKYSIGDDTCTAPVIISVFNSNLRIDMNNEVDSIPVDSETYLLSSDKNLKLTTNLSFYHGTMRMPIRKIYATIDIFTDIFIQSLDYNFNDTIDLTELCDAWHLHINTEYLINLILTANNVFELDDTLPVIQQTLYTELCNHSDDIDYIFSWIAANISTQFIIERMIMNAITVKLSSGKSILVPTYKCKKGENGVGILITEDSYPVNNDVLGNNAIVGESDVKIEITALSDSTTDYTAKVGSINRINYTGTVSVYPAHKIFPKIIDQRIPIKFTVTGSHKASDDDVTSEDIANFNATLPNALKPNIGLTAEEAEAYNLAITNELITGSIKEEGSILTAEEAAIYNATLPGSSTGEIYESAGLFSLMIFEGDGVFQLLPSCTEIKETSLGIQFATGGRTTQIFEVRNPDTGNLYIDTVTEDTKVENIDYISCKILYRKGAEDTSIYMNYNDVSNYLILEISDDGGAYINPTIWAGENGMYIGSEHANIPVLEEIRTDEETHTDYTVLHPWSPTRNWTDNRSDTSIKKTKIVDASVADYCKYYNIGTGYYPNIPLFTEKVLNDILENNKQKSAWYISNAITFKLKLRQYNNATKRYTDVLVDSETIPVVKDGQDGLDGAAQARNYLDGTDDGSEYTRRLSVKYITDLYYHDPTNFNNNYIISCPIHMYINSAINNAVKMQISSTERDYVRFSGLLKLNEYHQDIIRGGNGYSISWGKPRIILTLAVSVNDGKNVIKEGTYYKSEVLFDVLEHDGSRFIRQEILDSLYNTLNTTQELKVFTNISMQSYMAKNSDGDEQLLSTESGADNQLSTFGFDINGYNKFGINVVASGETLSISKDIYIDLFTEPCIYIDDEGHEISNPNTIYMARQTNDEDDDSIVIDYTLKWYATAAGEVELEKDTVYAAKEISFVRYPIFPYIKVSIVNPTLVADNVLDVSTININSLQELRTIRKQKDDIISLNELISVPEKFHKNSYVKISTFMLPEIEIEYNSFKLETEADAPKVPTTWTLSEADKKKQPNYNILFGAETNYYENNPYWSILSGPKNSMNIDGTDEEGKGVLKLSATSAVIKCKNANIITPNSEVYYTFSFDAMYNAADIAGGKIDVYFIYAYNPPFESVGSTYTQTTIDDQQYTYETPDGDIVIPPSLDKADVFDDVTGTYVFAHEQFELTKSYQRFAMSTNHVRKIKQEVLFDAPYVYNFYIVIQHPGSAQGLARRSEVYIKRCKLERGLFPTPYEINLDEYKGCTYDLIPYFETVEVRTNKPMNVDAFDVTKDYEEFKSLRTYDDETTGETVSVNLADSNIYALEEIQDDENIMAWYTFFDDYSGVIDDNTIAYITTGIAPSNVATPTIIHDIDNTFKIDITCATDYATIFYLKILKILYKTDESELITDYDVVTIKNGTIFRHGGTTPTIEILTNSATIYAVAKRDLYNNSELATYVYNAKSTYIKNLSGIYTSYIDNNSLSMGKISTISLKNNIVIFGPTDAEKIKNKDINTFIFTFDTNKEFRKESYTIIVQKYIYSYGTFQLSGNSTYIIIYRSESNQEHVIKYTNNIHVNANEYLGFSSENDVELSININNYSSYYMNSSEKTGYELNVDVGYTNAASPT